ncbi:MAG: DUF4351 domain-containing protein [Aulosira sp. DedQUE10]|nr:DUF4351 domain-containing protein [Aulosira sp. DedQUE10]
MSNAVPYCVLHPNENRYISACVQLLAGLRFENNLIKQLFREDIMQESVIYQDILQKGEQKGLQKGEVAIILRLLIRRLGAIEPQTEQQIQALAIAQKTIQPILPS